MFTTTVARPVDVTDIVDGACFRDQSWETLCLAGIRVPVMKSVRLGNKPEPHAVESRNYLYQRLFNMQIDVERAGVPDKWGIQPIILTLPDSKAPFQIELLREGYAFIGTQPSDMSAPDFTEFRKAQAEAREAERGLWQNKRYRILDAETAAEGRDQYRFVRGEILDVAIRADRTYLNFGADYRTDFTITIEGDRYRKWQKDGFDAMDFKNQTVEVFGLIQEYNGPSISLDDPSLLYILE